MNSSCNEQLVTLHGDFAYVFYACMHVFPPLEENSQDH